MERGLALKWLKQGDLINKPYHDIAGIAVNSDWATKNRELATNFTVAWLKGAREYLDAALRKPNREEVVKIIIKHTRVKDPAMYDKMEWSYINPNGFVDEASLADQIKWHYDNGFLETRLPVEKIVDNSYLRRAIEKLGSQPEPRWPW